MSYKIYDHSDNILKVGLIGDIDKNLAEAYQVEIFGILESYTERDPLSFLVDSSQEGHLSMYARRVITQISNDHRVDRLAVINTKSVSRVIATFITKATGRENIRFFDDEESARDWLLTSQ